MKSAKVVKFKQLSQKILKSFLIYNYETGIFTWTKDVGSKIQFGDIAGSKKKDGYVCITINKETYFAHRLAWLYMTGSMPIKDIDHMNGVRHDNRFDNLREATRSQNVQNQTKPSKNNTTGYLGVSFDKKMQKFDASIRVDKKHMRLGYFDTAEEASQAYLEAKRKYHEYCTI